MLVPARRLTTFNEHQELPLGTAISIVTSTSGICQLPKMQIVDKCVHSSPYFDLPGSWTGQGPAFESGQTAAPDHECHAAARTENGPAVELQYASQVSMQ